MNVIFRYMKPYTKMILLAIFIKFLGTVSELFLPYVLEHIIDNVVPSENMKLVVQWGLLLFLTALLTWGFNVLANRTAIRNAHFVSYDIRQDLFAKTLNLNGRQFDFFGLPSIISRMTSDSYNVQAAVQRLQSLCVRAPMMLVGGIFMMLIMDGYLARILLYMLPVLFSIILFISSRGIPLFGIVQKKLDDVVRIMRENITGIRVVKALSKTEYEKRRFRAANDVMAQSDIHASTVMALPGPLMQTLLNIGLTLVVFIGAHRVNDGVTQPGVILAFLTYFNMITMGMMGLNRIFVSMSRASASATRIGEVIDTPTDQDILPVEEGLKPSGDGFIRFENVSFSYARDVQTQNAEFAGGERQNALDDISFSIKKGESLGIIGPTGCGKTTIVNLMMCYYHADGGGVFVDGCDVRTYDKDELHRKFGTVFQNDMVFMDTLRENIRFGRDISDEEIARAASAAQADYIDDLEDGFDHMASIKGANLSGGQKQRLLVARALAGRPEILVLDDSSSALDYKTDAAMRREIGAQYKDSTMIMIAQRVSSVMGMRHVLVMDNGKCVGYGTHEELMDTCGAYREIYASQMGEMN
ncbi:MAG: ABC transporter ATP-binding protein [Christensenellales bacterium]|jgi:ATP-binding cassette subfamily B multidrug efflux pump